jgi:hypothetical protein
MADLVIVSMHEKGFPQADMYRDASEIPAREFEAFGRSPDDFFTMSKGNAPHDAVVKAKERWPGAFVVTVLDDPDDEDEVDDNVGKFNAPNRF